MCKAKRNRRYRDSWRGYLVDHHSPDPPVQPLDHLDVCEWEDALKRAHVNCMLTYCKDHYGVTYYDTRVGRKHPGLQTDWIAEVAEMLRRNDIEFWAYYSLGFDKWAADNHPDWRLLDEHGNPRRAGAKWPFVCCNTGYREYMMAQLAEIFAYQPDSLFLDIVATPLCWCEACTTLFRERYGMEMPRGDAKVEHWRTLQDWHVEVLQYDLFKMLVDHVHAVDPRVPISINGCHLHNPRKVMDLMDWTYAEPWAGNFVSAGFARGVGVDAQIGPGGLSQVYNPYPPSVFVAEIAGIAAQGVRPFLFSGTLKPDGSLERLEFDEIGAAYGEVEKYQKLLRNRDAIKDVAIVFSEQTRLWGLDEIRFREDPWMPLVDAPYTEAVAGAINAGAVAKVACEVVPAWNLCSEELAQYRALILPNMTAMSDEQAAVIAEWVEAGGSLLATMRTGMGDEKGGARLTSALGEVLGVEYLGTDRSYVGTNAYGSYLEDRVGAMWDDLPDTCLAVAPPMVKVRAKGAEVLATHTMPSCRETAEQWVNWGSPPPMTKTEWPAVTLNRYGQGLAMYVGFDLFNMMRAGGNPFVWAWQFVAAAMRNTLLPKPRIQVVTDANRSLDATFFRVRGKERVLVHLLNGTVKTLNGDVLSIEGARLVVRDVGFKVKRARVVYPEKKALKVKRKGGKWRVKVGDVTMHTIVMLEG